MPAEPRASLVIPFRNANPERLRNLELVLRHYARFFPAWELLLVEQDKVPTDFSFLAGIGFRHLLIEDGGPFNRSRLANAGAHASRHEILGIGDADLILQPKDLALSARIVESELEFIRPFRSVTDLSPAQTVEFSHSGRLPLGQAEGQDRKAAGEHIRLASGIFLIRKSVFMELGGMDDRFEGWGGEDDAFSIKVQKLVSRRGAAREAPAWHLWHPRAKSETPDLYRRNLELLKTYRQLDDEQLEKMCREQYKLLQDFSAYREVPARQA